MDMTLVIWRRVLAEDTIEGIGRDLGPTHRTTGYKGHRRSHVNRVV
jgi:hypothetical protein